MLDADDQSRVIRQRVRTGAQRLDPQSISHQTVLANLLQQSIKQLAMPVGPKPAAKARQRTLVGQMVIEPQSWKPAISEIGLDAFPQSRIGEVFMIKQQFELDHEDRFDARTSNITGVKIFDGLPEPQEINMLVSASHPVIKLDGSIKDGLIEQRKFGSDKGLEHGHPFPSDEASIQQQRPSSRSSIPREEQFAPIHFFNGFLRLRAKLSLVQKFRRAGRDAVGSLTCRRVCVLQGRRSPGTSWNAFWKAVRDVAPFGTGRGSALWIRGRSIY